MSTSDESDLPHVDGYSDLELIGRGGFSLVYSATQLGIGRRVALKVIAAAGADARRLEREAAALGALSNVEHALSVFAVTRADDGRPVLVVPLMVESLAQRISTRGACTSTEVARWARQLGGALDEAHVLGIHHRDVKPENVLLSAGGDAFLADFGIATMQSLGAATTTMFSLSPPHAAPERFSGTEPGGIAGDIYSLASTLYAALAGSPPFGTASSGGALGLMRRVAEDPVPPIEGIEPAANEALIKALAKIPIDRPASAMAFVDEFVEALTEGDRRRAPEVLVGSRAVPAEAGPIDESTVRRVEVKPDLERLRRDAPRPVDQPTEGKRVSPTADHDNAVAPEKPTRRRGRWWIAFGATTVVAAAIGALPLFIRDSAVGDSAAPTAAALTSAAPTSASLESVLPLSEKWTLRVSVVDQTGRHPLPLNPRVIVDGVSQPLSKEVTSFDAVGPTMVWARIGSTTHGGIVEPSGGDLKIKVSDNGVYYARDTGEVVLLGPR